MTSKLSRFLHLERSRTERTEPEASSRLQSGGRFETLQERGEAPQETAVPEAHLERFKGQAPLALADVPEEALRFPRCAVCESENGRYSTECGVCGADLGTPQQREYNERRWRERGQGLNQTRDAEAEQLRQRGAERREDAERFAQQLRQLREEEQTHRWVRIFSQHSTIGTALLSLIPHPLARWLTLAAVFSVPLAMWRYGDGDTKFVGAMTGVFVVALFVPPKSRWGR
ncbi:hypothetical protein ACLESO_47400 [Pyxidicoccus sp. 3LG]